MQSRISSLEPPRYCHYAGGPCDQAMKDLVAIEGFFLYPSKPQHLARTVADSVKVLQQQGDPNAWLTWEELQPAGLIVFCEICKAIRRARLVVANITSTNFNVLFELGYAIGARKPVLPVRDTSYEVQGRLLDEIGIFDTLGYLPFSNSQELASLVSSKRALSPPVYVAPDPNRQQPIYYLRSPIETDGSVKLFSSLKKSYFRFRTFDARELPRLSMHEAYKQVLSSVSVVAHLLDPERTGALAHNARAAFVCGMALAAGKQVLMLQEGESRQPIDYRDLVIPYVEPSTIPIQVEAFVRATAEKLQESETAQAPLPRRLLERIDLGDVAAENEIKALASYFVKTPQFQQVRQGHARLVIGRKGAGKTALFYGVRSQFPQRGDTLVLDLKPEGHQFTRLRETVLSGLSEGLQLHTLTAFWHYLLLLELANKVIERAGSSAWQDPKALSQFKELQTSYQRHVQCEGDFSERLMSLVDRVVDGFPPGDKGELKTPEITRAIYASDIKNLNSLLTDHLTRFAAVWILFDNLDKGFPTRGLQREDILIVRCLLEATRKLQRDLERRSVDCAATVFIRRDVYDLLVDLTPDRGKESYVNLDWSDPELVKELLLRRFRYQAPELDGAFEDVWSKLFDPHINGESSFAYMLSRTFLRPRDILNFVRKCLQIAVSRNHSRVEQDDVRAAEHQYSQDLLDELRYEMRDVFPGCPDLPLAFMGMKGALSWKEIRERLAAIGVPEEMLDEVRRLLLWFSFLGIVGSDGDTFAYQYLYNMPKLEGLIADAKGTDRIYAIHPGFHMALAVGISTASQHSG